MRSTVSGDCRWLIVQCGLDGALCWHKPAGGGSPKLWLVYDPEGIEGRTETQVPGWMTGIGSAFTAGLAGALSEKGVPLHANNGLPGELRRGVTAGLTAARALLAVGFRSDPFRYPVEDVGKRVREGQDSFCDIEVPLPASPANPDGERC